MELSLRMMIFKIDVIYNILGSKDLKNLAEFSTTVRKGWNAQILTNVWEKIIGWLVQFTQNAAFYASFQFKLIVMFHFICSKEAFDMRGI